MSCNSGEYNQKIEQLESKIKSLEQTNQKLREDYEELENKYGKLKEKNNKLKEKRKKRYNNQSTAKIVSKIGGSIYWRFIGILLVIMPILFCLYLHVNKEYRNIFITLTTILVTYCFEPFFKIWTDKYKNEKLHKNLDFILNTLKIAMFFVLAAIYGSFFYILQDIPKTK